MVLARSMQPGASRDVDLAPGSSVQMACAIWNGEAEDMRGQKSISIWHELRMDP